MINSKRPPRGWRKSTHSGPDGNCVEVNTDDPNTVGIRDSKNPGGPELRVSPAAHDDFIVAVKAGRFNLA